MAARAMRAQRASRPLSSPGPSAFLPFFRGSLWKPGGAQDVKMLASF